MLGYAMKRVDTQKVDILPLELNFHVMCDGKREQCMFVCYDMLMLIYPTL